jgi:hypothetical protein
MATLSVLLRDLGVSALVAAVVVLLGALISRGALHRTDRLGAAAIAVGFAVGYNRVIGGGFRADDLISVLPLAAVVAALFAPRIASRAAPDAAVGAATRAGLVLVGIAAAATFYVGEQFHLTQLSVTTVGAAVGLVVGTQVAERAAPSARAPDPRPGAWAVVAGLLAAVGGFGAAAGVAPVAVALLAAGLVAAPLAARWGGTLGDALAVALPAGLGLAAVLVAR